MPGFMDSFRKAKSGFSKLGADLLDDGRVNRSNMRPEDMDRMTLLQLMKQGDTKAPSDKEKDETSKRVREASRKVLGGK